MKDEEFPLVAHQLMADPRVHAAKRQLLEVLREYQSQLVGVRPAREELRIPYHALLEQFAEARGSKLWFPYLGSGMGNGPLVELADGSVKYDFISGIGPHYLGHSHPEMVAAGIDAAMSNTIMQGHLQQNVDSVELCRYLVQCSGLDHCFLSTSGAMANENAMKIAFQKRAPANRILAFEKGFAGRTLLLSQVTDKPAYREGLPATFFVDYVPFFDAKNPEESTKKTIAFLEKCFARYPNQYAVMVLELIQGEGGFYPGSREFFLSVMQLLKKHQVSVFVDEVQSFGRTSELFAFQHFGLEEFVDIVSIGKLSQVCGTLFRKDHTPRAGLLSQTFTASTSAIKGAMVVLKHLMEGNFFGDSGKNLQVERWFAERLGKLAEKYPGLISPPFGVGAMVAFTLFDGNGQRTTDFVRALFEAGVISFTAGANPTRVRFLVPAAAITVSDVDAVLKIVEETLTKSMR